MLSMCLSFKQKNCRLSYYILEYVLKSQILTSLVSFEDIKTYSSFVFSDQKKRNLNSNCLKIFEDLCWQNNKKIIFLSIRLYVTDYCTILVFSWFWNHFCFTFVYFYYFCFLTTSDNSMVIRLGFSTNFFSPSFLHLWISGEEEGKYSKVDE